jgi:hypothetical protein
MPGLAPCSLGRRSTRKIAAALLTVSLACSGCSAENTAVSVYVDPPTNGNACVGVVGFEITMNSGTDSWASGPLLGMAPVLDPAACRIVRPFAVKGIALDAALTVTVFGYDSARVARVSGTTQVQSLAGPPIHVSLSGVGTKPEVLVIARRPLLGGAVLGDVTRMVVDTQMRPQNLLDVDAEAAGSYFYDVEPGAFGVDSVPEPDLTADFTLRQGTMVPKARLLATQNVSYWQTQPR